MVQLHALFFEVLTSNVNFAKMRAAASFNILPDHADDLKKNAINEFLLRTELRNDELPQDCLRRSFFEDFDTSMLSKFSYRFPQFLLTFFSKLLKPLVPMENDTGKLAYQLTVNAYVAFEEDAEAWHSKNKRTRRTYPKVTVELDKAIKAIQKIHEYEMSFNLHFKSKKSI